MNKLLVIVDVQNDFINGRLGSFEAASAVPYIVKKALSWDGDIVMTKDTHHKDYLSTNEGKHLPVEHCVVDTHGWEFNPYMMDAFSKKDIRPYVIYKDTFGSKSLANLCVERGYGRIEVVGLCTDICVIVNAMLIKTYCPEADVVVDAKCCAGTSFELHEAALKVMKSCHVDIVNWKGAD